jgi:thiamine-monophosphate kinase
MRIAEIGGEFAFIERIRGPHAAAKGGGLVVPVGDDAAVLDIPAGRQVVVTTDMLVENIHFRRDWGDAYSIGWKAAAANLSDLAAMGAEPGYAFIALGVSEEDTVEGLERLYDGFSDCLNRYGARLAGGDTSASPQGLVVSVTLLGTVEAGRALTRTGARIGDALLVTGTLGNAAAGIRLLETLGAAKAERTHRDLVNAYRRPPPRVPAGRAAAATGKVRAALDLSDGLAGDLVKLCAASGVGARIERARLPLSDGLRAAATELGQDPAALSLSGGEDYELLLSVPVSDVEAVQAATAAVGVPCTVIGEIARSGLRVIEPDGTETDLADAGLGWDHFAS